MAGPGDEIAAGAGGRGHPRASHADREQVIGTLKAAFVQGMRSHSPGAPGRRIGAAALTAVRPELGLLVRTRVPVGAVNGVVADPRAVGRVHRPTPRYRLTRHSRCARTRPPRRCAMASPT